MGVVDGVLVVLWVVLGGFGVFRWSLSGDFGLSLLVLWSLASRSLEQV